MSVDSHPTAWDEPLSLVGERSRTGAGAPSAGELAWIVTLPAALVATLAIWLLGPPLGHALFPPYPFEFWPSWSPSFSHEAAEQGRFLVALGAPLLLAALTIVGNSSVSRHRWRASRRTTEGLVAAAEWGLVAFVVVCLAVQRAHRFGVLYTQDPAVTLQQGYFSPATLVVAALLTAAVALGVRVRPVRERVTAWARDTPARRHVATAVAAAATAIWLLHAFNTEESIGTANADVAFHLQFTLDETFSVLDGRTPFVDFVPLYGFLWPYVFAGGMALLGDSIGVFLALALLATALGMLAIHAVVRRVTHSPLAALCLFLPVLASSFFLVRGTLEDRYTFATLNGTFPMRYAGPFVLAWLVARHLGGARPRAPWVLFGVAGLVVLNNADTGVPALGATFAALLWTLGRPSIARVARLVLWLVAGLAIALALVSTLTLLRAGALPDLGSLLYFARAFGAGGFLLLPMPTLGLHLVIYVTFVAALGVATVRALVRAPGTALTGLLAFSGTFGLGAGAYYVGRSHPENLVATFTTWAFALSLLLVVVLHAVASRPSHRTRPAEVACIFGFAVLACSLAQTPLPWQQLDRLQRTAAPIYARPDGQALVDRWTVPGEPVLILAHLGHRIAVNTGIDNVAPYNGAFAMPLVEQLDTAIEALRDAGGRKLFISTAGIAPDVREGVARAGFALRATDRTGLQLWIATR